MSTYKELVDKFNEIELEDDVGFSESSDKILHKCLNPFTNLQTVSINYNDVCEDLLKTLALNCRLQSLCITCKTVSAFSVPKNLHSIPDDVWREVKELSPQLKVGLILGFANWTLNYLRKVLSSEVPLFWLHYDTDVPKNNCLQYLTENFYDTLEDVNLNFVSLIQSSYELDDDDDDEETESAELSVLDYDEEEDKEAEREAKKGELYEKDHEIVDDDDDSQSDNDYKASEIKWDDRYEEAVGYLHETPECVDESLVEFVKSCSKLKSLKVWGRFDLETLDKLCTLRKENKIGLEYLHMYFFDLSSEQRQLLAAKKDQYDAMNLPFQKLSFYEMDIDDESDYSSD